MHLCLFCRLGVRKNDPMASKLGVNDFRGAITSTGQVVRLAHIPLCTHTMFSLLLAISDALVGYLVDL